MLFSKKAKARKVNFNSHEASIKLGGLHSEVIKRLEKRLSNYLDWNNNFQVLDLIDNVEVNFDEFYCPLITISFTTKQRFSGKYTIFVGTHSESIELKYSLIVSPDSNKFFEEVLNKFDS